MLQISEIVRKTEEMFDTIQRAFLRGRAEPPGHHCITRRRARGPMAGVVSTRYGTPAARSIGYLYAINKRYPFVISIIICTLALLMAVRLENVREYKKDIKTVKELSEEFFANQTFRSEALVSKVPQVVLLPFVGYVIDDKGLSYSLVMIFICLSVAGGILLESYYRGKIM